MSVKNFINRERAARSYRITEFPGHCPECNTALPRPGHHPFGQCNPNPTAFFTCQCRRWQTGSETGWSSGPGIRGDPTINGPRLHGAIPNTMERLAHAYYISGEKIPERWKQ